MHTRDDADADADTGVRLLVDVELVRDATGWRRAPGRVQIHVAGALVWLIVVFVQTNRGRFSRQRNTGLQVCAMYWTFVVLLWPILYGLVYLY